MVTTTRILGGQSTRQVSRLTAVALGGIAYFALMIVALHFVRPDLNPTSQPTSAYAVGPYGFLMATAFFSLSLASWALVFGLSQGVPARARSPVGLGMLGLWAVGVLIAMLFPMDAEGAPPTLAGKIHQASGFLTFMSISLGAFLVTRRLGQAEAWRPVARTLWWLSLGLLAEYVVMGTLVASNAPIIGLAQRLYLVTFAAWFVLIACQLRSSAAAAHETR